MTSTTNTVRLHASDGGGDEDEDFDWEAAVREIDVACQNATNNNNPSSSSFHFAADNRRKTGTCKQSTLDRFVGKVGPRPASRTEHPPAATVSAGGRWVQEEEEEEEVRFVQEGEERVGSVQIDAEAAKTWIYPVNIPLRDYQLAITKTALFSNTLVALPTGLGKTLIAAVVMYNYFRWFPDGKIVFAAPSRPLVMQQIEACHNIVGIPQEWTIDMTGQINPTRRADFWKTKRVFFVTPQVLEKDIQAGTCLARYLVCLVIDEAHRALGNYSYCVAVRELMSLPVQLRILALTATPGSKQQAIQHIIDNLQISTLEYRNESDPDVIPYVHNRKIELIEVPMGQNALDINKRLLDVIRPYVARLSAIGLLQNRDFQTLSPPDLLNSRDKFRQAPPPGLPQNKYGEIEAYFGGLITLYHVRKLLSSHGIRPAYEMLEEKLKQGPFARLMSKNEDIRKVKLLMLQSLSHGAPSPKLSKMLEVLVDHFKTKDPKQSRVIIFSNFRGSVRDIMTALSNIGDLVKATEFIGQSSGKALKGQSQKVQQAVLKKFRSGGYNVIVATSIGEEGLDIMEVDLVICFDANVSPLRMIQRMGRTGRKHDGRVVVLACEGSELKGYMRKQANGRTIRKHMHNGGINSFTFHCSPRMIPHIFKPEVQFVELSIEQYVPHGRKVKDDNAMQTPVFNEKLTDAETALIAKYFQSTRGSTWRPSLIAFPRFQAFPSRVYKVMHSYRTNMLIDTMQHLQGLSFSGDNRSPIAQDELISSTCREADTVGKEENTKEDLLTLDDSPSKKSQKNVTDFELSPGMAFAANKNNSVLDISDQRPPAHSFLFGSDFVSVGPFGKVHIMSVPCLLLKDVTNSQNLSSSPMVLLNHMKKNLSGVKTLSEDYEEPATVAKLELKTRSWTQSKTSCNSQQENTLNQVEKVLETPILKRNMSDVETYAGKPLHPAETKAPHQQADEYRDPELSPRLTNMIQSGVVPESPIDNSGLSNVEGRREFHVPDVSPVKFCTELLPISPVARKIENAINSCAHQGNENVSPISKGLHTTLNKTKSIPRTGGCSSISPIAEECNTPLANLSKTSCSEDWILSSGEKSGHAKQVSKLKRLRKLGDIGKSRNLGDGKKISPFSIPNNERPFTGSSPNLIKYGKKLVTNVKVFIEEEAEVSSGSEVSDDEEDENDSAYDNSFIDDKISPATTAQAEANRVDMMAIYRRSLLSQSPLERAFSSSAITPECGDPVSRLDESGSCSFKTSYSLNTLKTDSANQSTKGDSESFQPNSERLSVATCANNISGSETELETRKRKLSYCQSWSIPAVNLESEFSLVTEPPGEDLVQQGSTKKIDDDGETLHDDQFFAGLDLDAVEAQATLLLKHRTEVPVQKQDLVSNGDDHPNVNLNNSPSFDLGIW